MTYALFRVSPFGFAHPLGDVFVPADVSATAAVRAALEADDRTRRLVASVDPSWITTDRAGVIRVRRRSDESVSLRLVPLA